MSLVNMACVASGTSYHIWLQINNSHYHRVCVAMLMYCVVTLRNIVFFYGFLEEISVSSHCETLFFFYGFHEEIRMCISFDAIQTFTREL